ncbi:MAG: DEAD/DEAH box helicase [Alphaproteobacteria bacterium]|nr:DEAD/DEAH box helicase [Alphaproteobacteria bacterium]
MSETVLTDTFFTNFDLHPLLAQGLADAGFTRCTPIQELTLPVALSGRDVAGQAQTGTGKTCAFLVAMMNRLLTQPAAADRKDSDPRALVIAPTRELAIQIDASLRTYGRALKLRQCVIFGGVSQNRQVQDLAKGVDVLVATPGRLLDLITQRHLRLDHVEVFIVDEADRMLDMGFIRDVRRIVAMLPKARQSMLFSATMPDDVVKLVGDMLKEPERIEIVPQSRPAERIEQRVLFAESRQKRSVLARLLRDPDVKRAIVFTRTKHGANKVAEALEKTGFLAEAIHGNKSQNARQRALARFRSGEAPILVATDIAARGIDVDEITHVINFELPNEPESYVHRIGRTARAGASGVAISLVDESEKGLLRQIERVTRQRIQIVPPPEGVAEKTPDPQPVRPAARPPHNAAERTPGREGRRRPRRKSRAGRAQTSAPAAQASR